MGEPETDIIIIGAYIPPEYENKADY